jgi:serine/threonine protein kinase
LGVNFLHKCGIVHRDIKPENVLLGRDGHWKLADFGLCKLRVFTRSKTSGVCGTRRYMAPEIRRGDLYGPEVGWWSVGCVVYEMMLGMCRDSYDCVCREQFPTYVTHAAVSILRDFLQRDPRRRLGARCDTRSILRHPFFKNVNCEAVLQKRVTPPVKPPTLEFLNIDPDAPGHGDDVGRNPSIENRH